MVIVINAVISLLKKSIKDSISFIIFLAVLLVMMFLDISPIILVLCAGIPGIIIGILKSPKGSVPNVIYLRLFY